MRRERQGRHRRGCKRADVASRRELDEAWETISRLYERAMAMLAFPLEEKTISEDGRVTIIRPAGWTYADVVEMARLWCELQQAVLKMAIKPDSECSPAELEGKRRAREEFYARQLPPDEDEPRGSPGAGSR